LLEQRTRQHPGRTFLIFAEDGREWTYAEFNAAVDRVAAELARRGVRRGHTVSILLPNCPEFLFVWFAAQKLGALAGVINTRLKVPEIEYIVRDSGARLMVTVLEHEPAARQLSAGGGLDVVLADELVQAARPGVLPSEPELGDPATIVYTSGTTGKPKGVLLSHANLCANALSCGANVELSERDRGLCILPLFHVNGTTVTVLMPLAVGGSIVLTTGFSASAFFPLLARHRATYFSAVPTVFSMLLNRPREELSGLDLGSLRFAICGGAPIAVETLKAFEEKFRMVILEGYGLTEATCGACVNSLDGPRKPGSIGIPLGGTELAIFDDQDRELPAYQRGEIVVRGPSVMLGYHKLAEETARALRGGFLHTGDIGYVDDEGHFYIVDRKKEMIIRGGENISPREIEEVLYAHPSVQDAAVIGIPDPIWGEEVKAFVVPRPGHASSVEEILAFCRVHLADFKMPKTLEFLAEMPKGATGKILKKELPRG
jgi:long-chain acyl-CoA synthetase